MDKRPIGIFDSGIGGITVLAEAARTMPGQRFIYFGDTANAPYGTKDVQRVVQLSMKAAGFLMDRNIKALIVACNTATSAAIDQLREALDIPVIGMEPALKPAVETGQGGTVVVMATSLTLREKKFSQLMEKYSSRASIIPMPCPGLVELIEAGIWEGKKIKDFLSKRFSGLRINDITDIVLGCTHYVFIKDEIQRFFDQRVRIVDGNQGTARQLRRILTAKEASGQDMLCNDFDQSLFEFYFSGNTNDTKNLCKSWLRTQLCLKTG